VTSTAVPVALTVTAPDYAVTAVPAPVGTVAGQAVSGTFTLVNSGGLAGSSPVNWSVYASLGNNTYGFGDTLLATGSTGPLSQGGGTSSPGWAGTWPEPSGSYWIVVRAWTADDPSIADAATSISTAVNAPPPPDYTASFSTAMPWSGLAGTAMSLTGTCQITIQNLSANPGNKSIAWSVYISSDTVLDGSDALVQQGSRAALGGTGIAVVGFAGPWPGAPGNVYWLIASVQAADDASPTNNIVTAPHACAVGDLRYVEGGENNNGSGAPPGPQTSDTLVTLAANQTMVIQGAMDASGNYDTYGFTAGTAMTGLGIRSVWQTGTDALDLWVWDQVAFERAAQSYGPDAEPGAGAWNMAAGIPATARIFVSAQFWSSVVSSTYVILVKGLQ
jgi:hypothetical protein